MLCDLFTGLLPVRYGGYLFGHEILYSLLCSPLDKFTKLRNTKYLNSIIFMDSTSKDGPLTTILKAFVKRNFQ